MKLISWNIARKIARCEEQFLALRMFGPDLVALQEVLPKAANKLGRLLPEIGLTYVFDTALAAAERARSSGVLIASRWPIQKTGEQFNIPYPERSLSVQVRAPALRFEVHTVHVPPGIGNGRIMIDTLDGVYDGLSLPSSLPRILCGDFNSPKAELSDGQIITWGQSVRRNGAVKVMRGRDRWDRAERSIIAGLAQYGFVDVFRHLNGYDAQDRSWRQNWSRGLGYRIDHIFASLTLKPIRCSYLHQLRDVGLSDHSPMEAVFGDG